MGGGMANSEDPMKRLAKLEKNAEILTKDVHQLKVAALRTVEILADHSEQLSGLQRGMDGLQRGMDGLQRGMDMMVERLDRLISATIQERTASTERLGDIERRLTRLEERVGV
jgi:hypothetical protein